MSDNNNILISIKEINEVSFNLRPLPIPIEQVKFGENLSVDIGFRFAVDVTTNTFKFFTTLSYSLSGIEEPVIELEIEMVFDVENISQVVKIDGDESMKIEDGFVITLAGVCIGTIRGVLATNIKGNPLSRFPLPIMNPQVIVDEMKRKTEIR